MSTGARRAGHPSLVTTLLPWLSTLQVEAARAVGGLVALRQALARCEALEADAAAAGSTADADAAC